MNIQNTVPGHESWSFISLNCNITQFIKVLCVLRQTLEHGMTFHIIGVSLFNMRIFSTFQLLLGPNTPINLWLHSEYPIRIKQSVQKVIISTLNHAYPAYSQKKRKKYISLGRVHFYFHVLYLEIFLCTIMSVIRSESVYF